MIKSIQLQCGKVDILVNNAGIAKKQGLEEITEEDWDSIMTVNVKSVFLVTQVSTRDLPC
jgi:NADP-dependent 3-hydroxy acid dehydrogenase YdfG